MAARIKFDNTHNVIQPTFVLATRAGHKLGSIPATNISVSDSFNSCFELEFQVNQSDNGQKYHLWDKITDFKLVWCREWDVWFEMYVSVQDDNDTVKNVSCISLGEAELSQINLYNIEINTEDDIAREDYSPTVLYNEKDTNASLLHRIMEKAPHYRIKHVDASIASIQRTFTFGNTSLYDAFQEIAEEIDCIFVIDSGTADDGSISRSISVCDLESYCVECGHRDNFTGKCPKCGSDNILTGYGQDTSIFISTENLANNITLKTDTDSVKNCFRLEAGDDLMTATIMSCNPNGSQYIWYISDETKKDMSDELVSVLAEYDKTYDYYYDEHELTFAGTTLTDYNKLVTKYHAYNEDLHTIPESIVGYPELMNVYYDTIDLYLFLHDSFMPSPETSRTTAALQAARLGSNTLSPVAVQDLSKCSSSTASSAVLSVAKTIVDPQYQVKVKNGVFNDNIWVGNFTVTNYSDETDTADSVMATVVINDNYETYVKQKLEKVLKNKQDDSDNANDIMSLFKLELNSFKIEIQKYCLTSLNTFCDACQSCLDILIEQGIADNETWASQNPNLYTTLYLNYYDKLMALQDEAKLREEEIAVIIGTYDTEGDLKTEGLQAIIESEKDKIQDSLNMEKFLGNDLWLEFISYRREDTYSNDNYISDGLDNGELFNRALEFIEVAKKEIYKSSTLQHSLSASLKNLLVMKEFEPIVDKFSVGNWIRVKVDNDIYRLRLISYSIDFDDLDDISIEFSDVKKYVDCVSDSEDILNQAASMATSYDAVTRQASQGNKSKKQLEDWVTKGLALTKMKIIDSADNQNITWDSHGLLCREYLPITDNYNDKQLKIINRGLYLTDNNWMTSRAGIGDFTFYNPETGMIEESYGVIADTLVGNLVLSKKVGIYNMDNSIVIDENGFRISDNNGTVSYFKNDGSFSLGNGNLVYDGKILHITGDGAGIDISSNSTISGLSTRITANAEGLNLRVEKNGVIAAINASSESVSISANKINLNGAVTANNYFKINTDGSMECTNAKVSGNITASTLTANTSGTIAGWNIGSGGISYDSSEYTVHVLTGTNASKDFLVVYDKSSGTWPFYVHADGMVYSNKLTAVNANISGTITTGNLTATGGKIANFTISGGYLFNGIGIGTAGSCGISCGSSLSGSDDWIFWAGNGVFRVNKNGQAWLSNATISGSITATSLSVKNGIYMYSDSYTSKAVISLGAYSSTDTSPTIRIGWDCNYMYLGRYIAIDCVSGTNGGYVAEISGSGYSIYCAPTIEIPNNHYIQTETKAVNGNATIVPLIGLSGGDNIWIGGDGSDSEPVGKCYIVAENVYKRSGGSSTSLSDERYKTDIKNIANAEDFIMALSPKMYKFKDGTSDRYHAGFLAGKVKEAMDKTIGDFGVYVRYTFDEEVPIDPSNPDTYICGLRYEEIIAPHIQLTQNHHKKILTLENKVTQLEKRIEELERSIA